MLSWKEAFTKGQTPWKDEWYTRDHIWLPDIPSLKSFLDLVHIRYALLKPYFETKNYPLVESRELLPSFEPDLLEHKQLPGFSMVALERPIDYFQEIFQFDLFTAADSSLNEHELTEVRGRNYRTLRDRIHRSLHKELEERFSNIDIGNLDSYSALTPFLFGMDRAQVLALDNEEYNEASFHLAGVYASFPSDLDTEIKRFGLRIGKFAIGDNDMYIKNRTFVYQYLMELYGFPIASERRTSAALFARRLHKMGEKYLVRVLGQSDRTITTLWNEKPNKQYPMLEKIALVALDKDQVDKIPRLLEDGYFVDPKNRVVILRVRYHQHKFSHTNLRQDRALSVSSQEIVHPITGATLKGVNIIKDTTNMFLRLNDIVQGEYTGSIVYKRYELIESTDTDEKRLKFIFAWLCKHQGRIISYSDEFFGNVVKVLEDFLKSNDNQDMFNTHRELYEEIRSKCSYIFQARKVRILDELKDREFKGNKISYLVMLEEMTSILHELKFEIVNYFDEMAETMITIADEVISNKYLIKTYILKKPLTSQPNKNHLEVVKNYRKLVALSDEIKSIRKARRERADTTAA